MLRGLALDLQNRKGEGVRINSIVRKGRTSTLREDEGNSLVNS